MANGAAVPAVRKTHWAGTPEDIIAALRETHGMVSIAARKLGCNRSTIQSYTNRYASVREALSDAREMVTDTAELALYKAIRDGEAWAVCFYLKTQGRHRGYVERHEILVRQMAERIASERGLDAGRLIERAEQIANAHR